MFNSLPAVLPLVKAGRLRPLAVASAKRTPTLPELPTFAESGIPEFEAGSWYGVLAPAGTPRELIMRLHAETVQMLALPDIRQKLAAEGAEAIGYSPEEFAAQIRRDIERWEKVARAAKIPRQ
jgi:tripartite-type tricarboxylate transporter receptor subunit TctC